MDHEQKHDEKHRLERQEKQAHERQEEEQFSKPGPTIRPLWIFVVGFILVALAIVVWMWLWTRP
jgi:fatty acid desaturase